MLRYSCLTALCHSGFHRRASDLRSYYSSCSHTTKRKSNSVYRFYNPDNQLTRISPLAEKPFNINPCFSFLSRRKASFSTCSFENKGDERDHDIRFETAKFAQRTDGAILASVGNTTVLATCVTHSDVADKPGFLPLSVEYREKASAAGILPKNRMHRRDAAFQDSNILAARAIDRSIRPLFPEGFFYNTQIIVTLLSYDGENDPVALGINAASAALGIPWNGPIAAVRIGRINGNLVVDPHKVRTNEFKDDQNNTINDLDLLMVSKASNKIVMLECGSSEIETDEMMNIIEFAEEHINPILKSQETFQNVNGAIAENSKSFKMVTVPPDMLRAAYDLTYQLAYDMCLTPNITKDERRIAQTSFWDAANSLMRDRFGDDEDAFLLTTAVHEVLETALSDLALGRMRTGWNDDTELPMYVSRPSARPDGRLLEDIREINCESDVLPVVHGSGLFTRGNTQVLVTATLGSQADAPQIKSDVIEDPPTQNVMLHYDFPQYCVNRTGRMFINRRSIGHGNLAEKAILSVLPEADESFPFFLRLSSEVTSSDGSSSMATVCGSTLALLDAGVPIKHAVAGVSIGLYVDDSDDEVFVTLTDLLGMEDHFGKMDFKIAGTEHGITAMQLDIKRNYITKAMIRSALEKALKANSKILIKLSDAISEPNMNNDRLPTKRVVYIEPHQKQKLIGRRWENINAIERSTKSRIHVDNGKVTILSPNPTIANHAVELVQSSIN